MTPTSVIEQLLALHVVQLGLPVAGLLVLYAGCDWLLRREGWRTLFGRTKNEGAFVLITTILLSASALVWSWPTSTGWRAIRWFSTGVATILAWNAATRDLDPTRRQPTLWPQALVVPAALLSFFSPAFLMLSGVLLSVFLRFWLHHATFPMRLLQALLAGAALGSVAPWLNGALPQIPWTSPAALLCFIMIVQISHYFITAVAKGFLGPKWYSWVTDNKLHHLAASAYSWGWARFVPWNRWLNFIHALKRVERPLQLFAFTLEAAAPLALIHQHAGVAFSLSVAGFHLGVFAVAGLLFWDWILADMMIAGLILALPQSVLSAAFGPTALIVGLIVMALFPLRHKLWKPMPLGWFDTPLTARMHWSVIGEDGREYGLYNNFMCPHERLYGRVNACFFTPQPVLTYHLGEVWKPDLRAGIEAAGADPARLQALRERFGILPRSDELRGRHIAYLQGFFAALNAGGKKSILPPALRWLKAPGDQLFYWGKLPPYRRQDKAREVRIRFVEEYFDGERLVRLNDQEVCRFSVPATIPTECPEELTPKELDDYLLGLAQGRLIDLPGFKKSYTRVLSET